MRKLVAVIGVLLLAAACGSDGDSSGDPEAALNAWADGINSGSVDQTMAVFAEEAVLVDHPLHPGELNGKAQIVRGINVTVNSARDEDPYTVFDVAVDGDTVAWSYIWINAPGVTAPDGETFCGSIEADVNTDGLITEMRWGPDPGTEQCAAAEASP